MATGECHNSWSSPQYPACFGNGKCYPIGMGTRKVTKIAAMALLSAWLGLPAVRAWAAVAVVNSKYWHYESGGCERRKTVSGQAGTVTADGVFVIVKVRAKNMDDSPSTLRHSLFVLRDDTGATRDAAEVPDAVIKEVFGEDACACNMKRVQSGIAVTCYLFYDAPENIKSFRLEIHGGILDPGVKGYLDFSNCRYVASQENMGKGKSLWQRLKDRFWKKPAK